MHNPEQLNSLLNDLWNFHLTLFGIAITLFTLLYSFIIVRRDELKQIATQIKSNQYQPDTKQKELFAINYINQMKDINQKLTILMFISISLSVLGWIFERFIPDNCIFLAVKRVLVIALYVLTGIVLVFVIVQFRKIYKDYLNHTEI